MTQSSPRFVWPWQDRRGAFSWLKALTLAAMFYPAASMLYDYGIAEFDRFQITGYLYWSGVWATALLLLALAVTPLRRILQWPGLHAVRRIIGVSALIYTVVHIVFYFILDRWEWGRILAETTGRLTLIIATLSTIGLLALGLTSVDAAVRWLGAKNWNRLHQLNYVATPLAVVHYLLSPGIFATQYLLAGLLFWLMAWRLQARFGRAAEPRLLAALAVVSGLFTALFEAGWQWAYHDVDPAWPLGDNFTLVLGLSSAWQVLGLGLLVAIGAALFRNPRPLGLAAQAGQRH